jgi:hypothetical protein
MPIRHLPTIMTSGYKTGQAMVEPPNVRMTGCNRSGTVP